MKINTLKVCCDFQEIENNKFIISEQLENVDWESELSLERSNINLSSKLLINEVDRLINFWSPLQKISDKSKKTLSKPWMPKGIIKSIRNNEQTSQKKCVVWKTHLEKQNSKLN